MISSAYHIYNGSYQGYNLEKTALRNHPAPILNIMFEKNTTPDEKPEDVPNEGSDETPEETPTEVPVEKAEGEDEVKPVPIKTKLHRGMTARQRRIEDRRISRQK